MELSLASFFFHNNDDNNDGTTRNFNTNTNPEIDNTIPDPDLIEDLGDDSRSISTTIETHIDQNKVSEMSQKKENLIIPEQSVFIGKRNPLLETSDFQRVQSMVSWKEFEFCINKMLGMNGENRTEAFFQIHFNSSFLVISISFQMGYYFRLNHCLKKK